MEKEIAPKAAEQAKPTAKSLEGLSLVLEVTPGQADNGLMTVFEVGKWEKTELSDLVSEALGFERTIEERDLVSKIKQQLEGGKLLYQNKEIHSKAADYGVIEETEAGQKYLYVKLKAIKPQEGGRFY